MPSGKLVDMSISGNESGVSRPARWRLNEARSCNSAGGCVALLNNERPCPAAATTRFRYCSYQGCAPSLEGWKSCGTYYPLCFLLSSEQPRSRQPGSYVSRKRTWKRQTLVVNDTICFAEPSKYAEIEREECRSFLPCYLKSTHNLERTDPPPLLHASTI
jgi:hypothetical protein